MTADRDRVTAILTLAEAATEGPWWIEESAETWVLQGVAFRLAGGEDWPEQVVNKQILKAPKTGTPYAEYWPDGTDACFIAASRSETPWLARTLLEALDTIDRLKALVEAKERVTQRILREQMPERTPRPRLNGGNESGDDR